MVSFPYSKKDIQKYGKDFDGLILENANTEVQHDVGYKYYAVEKMKFPKKDDKSIISYNQYHMIRNIPKKAYEYVVNGKSAIEWIMMHYAITNDKKSGIVQNPNDWAEEHKKPRYILDLLLSVINVSLKTLDIVTGLPEIEWNRE